MTGPCKDCPDRAQGCHSVCEKYLAFRARCDEAAKKRMEESEGKARAWEGFQRVKKTHGIAKLARRREV